MSDFQTLATARRLRPLGRGPHCAESLVPNFTAARIRRGLSRRELAAALSEEIPSCDVRMIERIEVDGQRPTPELCDALARLWRISRPRARALFRKVA